MKKPLTSLYLLLTLACLPSIYYWLNGLGWEIENISLITLFPVFGLLAFTIMWFHLMTAWYKRHNPEMFNYRKFFRQTSNWVLVLILLHPLLLTIESLKIDIKPIDYAGPNGRFFILIAGIALLIFLSYEVTDRLREKPIIKNNWPIVVALNRVAMLLIFFHAIKLGTHLQTGAFKILWFGFGVSMLAYFISSYKNELTKKA